MAEYFAGGHLRFIDGEWRRDSGDVVYIREVKHGKWVEVDNAYGTEWLCDNCKMGVRQYQDQPYCSECGTKMNTQ